MLTLKENNEIKKAEMLLEAISFEDLKSMATTFKRIESSLNGIELPEISRALEIARDGIAMLQNRNKSIGQKAMGLVGQSKQQKTYKKTMGQLMAIQATLIKLIRELPTIMTLVSKAIKQESKGLNGDVLNEEVSAIQLAKQLGVQFQELQVRANELAGTKVINSPNDKVPQEVESGLKQSLNKRSSETEKIMGDPRQEDPEEKNKLGNLLGEKASERFVEFIVNSLNINQGFMSKILKFIGWSDNNDHGLDSRVIAQDLLNLNYEDFTRFVNQTKSLKNLQMGISKQDAQKLSKTTPEVNPSDSSKDQISTQDLYTSWRELFPGVKKSTLEKMVSGLTNKTIVADKAKPAEQKIKV